MPLPQDEQKAREVLKEERAKSDSEFEAARRQFQQQQQQPQPQPEQRAPEGRRPGAAAAPPPPPPRFDEKAVSRFEDLRRQRRERVERGGVAIIEEPGKRVIVREADREFIRHDEQERLGRSLREGRREKRPDGSSIIVNLGPNGLQIITVEDREDAFCADPAAIRMAAKSFCSTIARSMPGRATDKVRTSMPM